ncbi:MAG: hypothetical protein JW876_09665 [Candidatus Krumholzibacteriota bacterium]|nr:hypothetical protein [Candidatus Krumholzibacteriota bacterium]
MRNGSIRRSAALVAAIATATLLFSCSDDGGGVDTDGDGDGSGVVWFVDVNATGAGTGTSWADAFTDPQSAIDAASAWDSVWVAEGVYLHAGHDSVPVLRLAPDVVVLGGFQGVETAAVERVPGVYEAVLDGADAAWHVVVGAEGAVFDGFTIQGGNADGTGVDRRGGGVHLSGVGMRIANCVIRNNSADQAGGGLSAWNDRSLVIGCRFTANTMPQESGLGGGGCFLSGCETEVNGCTFDLNETETDGGALCIDEGSPTVLWCRLELNTASSGGAVHVDGANSSNNHPIFSGCLFEGNSATYGGGVDLFECVVTIDNCTFGENVVLQGGGAIYANRSTPAISNTGFFANDGTNSTGGVFLLSHFGALRATIHNCIFVDNRSTNGWGGGLYCHGTSPAITSSTFSANRSLNGGGICNYEAFPEITDCIVFGNIDSDGGANDNPDMANMQNSMPMVTFCDIGIAAYDGVNGNFNLSPVFCSGISGSYFLSQTACGQAATSPCVDAGSNTAAALGLDSRTTRTDGVTDTGAVDIGYHYAP